MNDKFLLMLAFDSLLLELDGDYEGVPDEVNQLLEAKVYESYGLEVTSTYENAAKMKESLLEDVRKYRDKLIEEIKRDQ